MWMLNEALLLLRKVVIIFEKKSDFKYYLLVGWGTILIICLSFLFFFLWGVLNHIILSKIPYFPFKSKATLRLSSGNE